jgi:hypothetical protein
MKLLNNQNAKKFPKFTYHIALYKIEKLFTEYRSGMKKIFDLEKTFLFFLAARIGATQCSVNILYFIFSKCTTCNLSAHHESYYI